MRLSVPPQDPQVLLDPQGQRFQHGRGAAGDGADPGDDRHVRDPPRPPRTPPRGFILTPAPSCRGSWRRLPFKPYNFSSLGLPPACGHLHPLLKVRSELRQIFLEMG